MSYKSFHSIDEIKDFIAMGGKITRLEFTINNPPDDISPLDQTLRQLAVRSAEANAGLTVGLLTLEDGDEPEIIFVIGITSEMVKMIQDHISGINPRIPDPEE